MPLNPEDLWTPGSFTKNFSWGRGHGLKRLYDHINVGFDGELVDVPRALYRRRVERLGVPDFIPINFFLFNKIKDGVDHVMVDELVFQALKEPHTSRFDKLALFAFNLSYVGSWRGAKRHQRRPAMWANRYVTLRVAHELKWKISHVNATDIEAQLRKMKHLEANESTYRKLATNLSFLYEVGGFAGFEETRISRWWVDALFLAADRLFADHELSGEVPSPNALPAMLLKANFNKLVGPETVEKSFATGHLVALYNICDGRSRFDPKKMRDRTAVMLPNYNWQTPNNDDPPGALHPTNPRILKLVPRSCASLAKSIGFEIVPSDDLEQFDPDEYIESRSKRVVSDLTRSGREPKISANELHELLRKK